MGFSEIVTLLAGWPAAILLGVGLLVAYALGCRVISEKHRNSAGQWDGIPPDDELSISETPEQRAWLAAQMLQQNWLLDHIKILMVFCIIVLLAILGTLLEQS